MALASLGIWDPLAPELVSNVLQTPLLPPASQHPPAGAGKVP